MFDRFYVDDLYCALHRSKTENRRNVCVVFASPIGRDARFTYRCMVIFADALAALGFDVLRFDPAGEGDSGDLALDADQWSLWTAGLAKVTNAARELTGASQTVLVGLRIGGTMARVVAQQAGIDGLVLLDPIAKGTAWLQELRVMEKVALNPKPPESAIESLGLRLSHGTAATIETVDLIDLPPLAIPCLYVSPVQNSGVVSGLGEAATTIPFKGYVSLFKEPFLNTYPKATFDAVAAWLTKQFRPGPGVRSQNPPSERELVGRGYVEEPVFFGSHHYGVVTWPADRKAQSAVVIGNTGGDPRAGAGNFSAFMARSLARRQIATLRLDFDGLGESEPVHALGSSVYDESRTAAFRAAADFMKTHGLDVPTLIGICAGGYHAVHTLIDDARFTKALAINTWLTVEPGMVLEREGFLRSLRSKFMDAQPELSHKVEPMLESARSLLPIARARKAEPPPALAEQTTEVGPAAKRNLQRFCDALDDGRIISLLTGERDPSRSGMERFGEDGARQLFQHGLVQQFEPIDHGLFALESQMIALGKIYEFLDTAEPSREETIIAYSQ